MAQSNFSGPLIDRQGGLPTDPANPVMRLMTVPLTLVAGAAAVSFQMPLNVFVTGVLLETPTAIPGTPTTTNLRIGNAANGQQFVADVDVDGAGVLTATVLQAARRASGTWFVTVASSGGTAAAQVGTVNVLVSYAYTG